MSESRRVTAVERLRERFAHVGDEGWLFATIADRVATRRIELGLSTTISPR